MRFTDLHVHTIFSDGNNTPEEMVLAAIDRGMEVIGFSDHSYTDFDESFCIPKAKLEEYRAVVGGLKKKYEDKITILCGIEQDFFSTAPTGCYDYTIGSVHYVKTGDVYIPVDNTAQHLLDGAKQCFDGDLYSLLEEYFRTVGCFAERKDISIVGHFDVVSKFNENDQLFDSKDPRYVAAWQEAAQRLITAGIPFEINTGAIARGYRTAPYPAAPMARFIRSHGGSFLLSSDSHMTDTLCFEFEKWEAFLQ